MKKKISLLEAILINTGTIIGAGIFVLLAICTKYAGRYVWLAVLLAGIFALISAFTYIELSKIYPTDGSEVKYTENILGKEAKALMFLLVSIGSILMIGAVSKGSANYTQQFIPGLGQNAIACLVIAIACLVNLDLRAVTTASSVSSFTEIFTLVIVAFVAMYYSSGTPTAAVESEVGVKKIFYASTIFLFAFWGYGQVTKFSSDIVEPEKNVPKAITYSIVISAVVFSLISFGAVKVLGAERLMNSDAPISELASTAFGKNSSRLLTLTSSVALFGGVSVLLSGQARMINDIEKSLSVPVSGLGVGAVTAACVYFCSMEQMSVLTNVVLTIVVIIINMALIKYHYENKEHKLSLPFEVGRVALFPVISTVLCVVMLYLVNGHSRG